MATSAYQLWLKKREFKAPRPPSSPASKSATSAPLTMSKDTSNSSQDAHEPSKADSTKSHSVSGVEITQVAVKSVSRPPVARKRTRGWISDREVTASGEERPPGDKVAARIYGDESKVAGRKRQRNDKEDLLKVTATKWASAAKVLRLSSIGRDGERAAWSGRVEKEAKVAAGERSDSNATKRLKGSSEQLKQPEDASSEEVGKWRIGARSSGTVEVKPVEQLTNSTPQKVVVEKRSLTEAASGDKTMKRMRFSDDSDEGELSGLLTTSAPKHRKMRTAMLDESQYWMAVDRFSHLT